MYSTDILENEHAPYYKTYISKSGSVSLIDGLQNSLVTAKSFYKTLPIDKLEYRYAEGKWTVKEIMQHIIDTERIFTYRALRFSRNDETALPGFEENDYAPVSKANNRTMTDILSEYQIVRQGTLSLFKSFDQDMLMRKGMASGSEMSVRAIGFVVLGHEAHHIQVIKERYL